MMIALLMWMWMWGTYATISVTASDKQPLTRFDVGVALLWPVFVPFAFAVKIYRDLVAV